MARHRVQITVREALGVLGVAAGATAKEVKAAYRRRAVQTHPDKGGSVEEFVKERR